MQLPTHTHFFFLLTITIALMSCQATGISDCNGGDYEGPYNDGDGTYLMSDTVTHPYKFPRIRKCWQEYFLVTSSNSLGPWEKSSGDVYCTGTKKCTVEKLTGTQHCVTKSVTLSADVSSSILKFLGANFRVSTALDDQQRFSASDTTACEWTDAQCHSVWTQQNFNNAMGFMRKRCNWGNGDEETDCMTNWRQTTPTTDVDYGCGSACMAMNTCGHTDGTTCPHVNFGAMAMRRITSEIAKDFQSLNRRLPWPVSKFGAEATGHFR